MAVSYNVLLMLLLQLVRCIYVQGSHTGGGNFCWLEISNVLTMDFEAELAEKEDESMDDSKTYIG